MNKKRLISSVSAMVLLLASPVLADETTPDLSNKPITTPTLDYLGKTSAYEITQGTETDYGFINLVADIEGNITKEYYKINLTGPKSVTWSADGDHEISLNLPNSETPTIYKYSINPDADLGTRIDNDLTQDKVDGKLFANIQSGGYGGAIEINNENVDINSDFIGNYTKNPVEGPGGAIYNSGTIGNINGDFIGNYALTIGNGSYAYGGAIYTVSTIGNIAGDFIGNYASANGDGSNAYGGAIGNETTINSITGDFIGNYAQTNGSESLAHGGAIFNSGTISDITGNFIGNYAKASNGTASGGAIDINGLANINRINGDFIGNYAQASGADGNAAGGAINNASISGILLGEYLNVNGDFIGNYATSESSLAQGGAILTYSPITITNASFIDNYVSGNTDSHGGAIYAYNNVTIIADGAQSEFTGNKVISSDENGNLNEHSEAVFLGSPSKLLGEEYVALSTLYLKSLNGGQIIFNDAVNAEENEETISGFLSKDGIVLTPLENGGFDMSDENGDYLGQVQKFNNNYLVPTEDASVISNEEFEAMLGEFQNSAGYDITKQGDNYVILIGGQLYTTFDKVDDGYLVNTGFVFSEKAGLVMSGDSKIDINNQLSNLYIESSVAEVNVSHGKYLNDNNALAIKSGVMKIADLGEENVHFTSFEVANGGTLNIGSTTADLEK